ncbi:LysM peptidoglycan-binding domain-containing protein [Candidatus Woesearchaeota archaeon]|nr:LysM peptidoglycan-binding domain-containing protein [Candidatus Woesearchaeota archaeon]
MNKDEFSESGRNFIKEMDYLMDKLIEENKEGLFDEYLETLENTSLDEMLDNLIEGEENIIREAYKKINEYKDVPEWFDENEKTLDFKEAENNYFRLNRLLEEKKCDVESELEEKIDEIRDEFEENPDIIDLDILKNYKERIKEIRDFSADMNLDSIKTRTDELFNLIDEKTQNIRERIYDFVNKKIEEAEEDERRKNELYDKKRELEKRFHNIDKSNIKYTQELGNIGDEAANLINRINLLEKKEELNEEELSKLEELKYFKNHVDESLEDMQKYIDDERKPIKRFFKKAIVGIGIATIILRMGMLYSYHKEHNNHDNPNDKTSQIQIYKTRDYYHIIKKNETLWQIKKDYTTAGSYDEILKNNPEINNPDLIYAGHILRIPKNIVKNNSDLNIYKKYADETLKIRKNQSLEEALAEKYGEVEKEYVRDVKLFNEKMGIETKRNPKEYCVYLPLTENVLDDMNIIRGE